MHELIRKHTPSMVILMETHCAFKRVERFWQKLGYDATAYSKAQGHSGGIWILVEQRRNYSVSLVNCFHQMVTISISMGAHKWWCSAIYANSTPVVRELLWAHICSIRSIVQGPWLLMGNYSEVLLPSEVKGGSFHAGRAQKLAQVIDHCNLIDPGCTGIFYTWTKHLHGQLMISKRLDPALADCNWCTAFPEAYVENLFRHHSDHSPMLIRCHSDIPSRKTRPFRFQVAWLTYNNFPSVVQKAWNSGNHLLPLSLHKDKKMHKILIPRHLEIFLNARHIWRLEFEAFNALLRLHIFLTWLLLNANCIGSTMMC